MAGTLSNCFICQKYAGIFHTCVAQVDAVGPPAVTAGDILGEWVKLPHSTRFSIVPDREEGQAIITSESDGKRVKGCGDVLEYSAQCRSAICDTDGSFLTQFILEDPGDPDANDCKLWYFTWDKTITATSLNTSFAIGANPVASDTRGFLAYGIAEVPGDFDVDSANAGNPLEVEWTVNITRGPYYPNLTPVTCNIP